MDDDQIRQILERARRLAEREPEPFRSLAYAALLTRFLQGGALAKETPGSAPLAASMDLAEFLAAKKVTTHPDRVVAIAYHAYHTQDGAGVTTHDLAEAYSRARVKKPQNFPDVIAACVRRGRLVEGERKDAMKSWVITRTGEEWIEQGM